MVENHENQSNWRAFVNDRIGWFAYFSVVCLLIGCGREARLPSIPDGHFRIEYSELVTASSMLVVVYKIQTLGEKSIRIRKGEHDSVGVGTRLPLSKKEEDPKALAECELVLTATLSELRDHSPMIHFLMQGRSIAGTATGIEVGGAAEGEELDDVFYVSKVEGNFAERFPLYLGSMNGEKLTLKFVDEL